MKTLDFIIAAVLLLLLAVESGCTLHYTRDNVGFWDQQVSATAWGIYYFSPYGPVGIGYLEWARNLPPRTELPTIKNPMK